ncbi:MAG: SDR family NAD(P)-dependent oxidoreductase [Kangiellaceae bacterium]|nr:SDR family NAD(P)-dependent oxidoreductase [Kangiellaceae bacterium]
MSKKYAVVTGASSGLGKQIACDLAIKHGYSLILIARRENRLLAVKEYILSRAQVEVASIPSDLNDSDSLDALVGKLDILPNIRVAVLAAGVTYFGELEKQNSSNIESINALNISANLKLIQWSSKYFRKLGQGGNIVIISSMAALIPTPYQAVYSASKAYISNLAKGLSQENKENNIFYTLVYPIGMKTEMTASNQLNSILEKNSLSVISVEKCSQSCIQAMFKNKKTVIPGLVGKIIYFLSLILPSSVILSYTASLYKKSLGKGE